MDTELLPLARAAVVALQNPPQPHWVEIAGVIVSAVIGIGQILLIAWGLRRIGVASDERNRQLDQQGEVSSKIGGALARQGEALARQSEVLGELLRRSA
jgi:hypothetical protein